jgi:HlyD family secretion protein
VKAGDVVAEFDPQNQLQRLDDYKDTVAQLERSITKMRADLASAMEVTNQAVRQAKADWDKAVLDLKTAPVRSDIDVEKNKLTVEQSELSYKEQFKQIALLQESQLAAIRSSEFSLGQAKLELQRAQNNVTKMTIHAPIDGMVVMANLVLNNEMRQIREGDQVFAGQPFMSIVDPRSMILNATVNQVDAQRLRLGMKGSVKLDAYPGLEFPAMLDGIGAMAKTSTFRASFVGEIPVRLKVTGVDPRLIPDLTGSAEVVLAREQGAVLVPRAAVFFDDAGAFVYVQRQEGWEQKRVEAGLSSFTEIAIRSGVQKGDVLAASRVL